MLRVVSTIILPLVLPTALYLLWLWLARRLSPATEPGDGPPWHALPWLWLAIAGVVLLGAVLALVSGSAGTAGPGVYVPPRWENGRIVPGHIEPPQSR